MLTCVSANVRNGVACYCSPAGRCGSYPELQLLCWCSLFCAHCRTAPTTSASTGPSVLMVTAPTPATAPAPRTTLANSAKQGLMWVKHHFLQLTNIPLALSVVSWRSLLEGVPSVTVAGGNSRHLFFAHGRFLLC